jgi:predicted DNA-binding protein (MmcQ/YjbR family)
MTSSSDWYQLRMSDSFVPKYKDAKAPDDPTAEIFTLGKYYANATNDHKQKAIQLASDPSSILQITTAYDTIS